MAEDYIDSYIDLEATGRESKELIAQMNEVLGVIKKMQAVKLTLKGSTTISETAKKTKELTEAQKEQLRIEKDLERTATKVAALETTKAKALAITKEELRKSTQELKNQIREQNAAEGSIEQMRAQLIRLNKEYDNLSKADRNSTFGQTLKNDIRAVDKELKQLEGETGRFQRRVGDYANAFGSALGTVEKSLDEIRKDINSGNFGGKQLDELQKKGKSPRGCH